MRTFNLHNIHIAEITASACHYYLFILVVFFDFLPFLFSTKIDDNLYPGRFYFSLNVVD